MPVPPQEVRDVAAKALEMRRKHGHGGTAVGVARARDLKNGKNIPIKTMKRMLSFFQRHSAYRYKHAIDPTGPAKISWMLWGGDPGYRWVVEVLKT